MNKAPSDPSRRLLVALRAFLKDRFNLEEDKANEQETINEIRRSVNFRGASLWILMFAILIASVGLNVNSTAVIIGAMLISPLMGPIMGIGLGVGTNDLDLIGQALKNLALAAGISIATSAIYFLITPLQEAQSELLARTTPTIWDVLIALFGGLAGIIAGSRREKSNAIPGVAIATALMPPLCTAGYGLGTGQLKYFIGAFYLFFINSVFITLATVLIVRALHFKRKEFPDAVLEKRVKRYIAILVFLAMVPSTFTAYQVVRRTVFEQQATLFISQEFQFENRQVIFKRITYQPGRQRIEVTLLGEPLTSDLEKLIRDRLLSPDYNLANTDLIIRQGFPDKGIDRETVEQLNEQLRAGLLEELFKKNEELRSEELPVYQLASEVSAIDTNLLEFSIAPSVVFRLDSLAPDTTYLAFASFRTPPTPEEKAQLEKWLKVRLHVNRLRLVSN